MFYWTPPLCSRWHVPPGWWCSPRPTCPAADCSNTYPAPPSSHCPDHLLQWGINKHQCIIDSLASPMWRISSGLRFFRPLLLSASSNMSWSGLELFASSDVTTNWRYLLRPRLGTMSWSLLSKFEMAPTVIPLDLRVSIAWRPSSRMR